MLLLVGLSPFDPEHESAHVEAPHGSVGADEPRRWMARAGADDEPTLRVDEEVGHRDELAGRDLAHHDVVRRLQEVRRRGMLARQGAEDELRHRHVGGRLDPVAGDVSEDDRQAPVVELDEVVDVAADLDARRRLVRVADVEARQLWQRSGQQ